MDFCQNSSEECGKSIAPIQPTFQPGQVQPSCARPRTSKPCPSLGLQPFTSPQVSPSIDRSHCDVLPAWSDCPSPGFNQPTAWRGVVGPERPDRQLCGRDSGAGSVNHLCGADASAYPAQAPDAADS